MNSFLDDFLPLKSLDDLSAVDHFIKTMAPSYLSKPGIDSDMIHKIESIKKDILLSFSKGKNKEKTRLEGMKSMILSIPKEKRQVMLYLFLMMGIWDGVESLDGEEIIEPMNPQDVHALYEWIESGIEGFDNEDVHGRSRLEFANAVNIMVSASNAGDVTDAIGFVIYQDSDFVVLHTEDNQIIGIQRNTMDDVGLYCGAYVYAQKELDGEMAGKFKLSKPGVTIER